MSKEKDLKEILDQAKCLKLEIWHYLDRNKKESKEIKCVMNDLLDSLEFLDEMDV